MGIRQSVLVDLDTLLDTRIGCVFQHAPESIEGIDFDAYAKRLYTDVHSYLNVDTSVWDEWWKNRDCDTLRLSLPTPFALLMRNFMSNRFIYGKTSPISDPLTITVNIWPYQLTSIERDAMVDELKGNVFWDEIKIDIIRTSPTELLPSMLKTYFDAAIMYNFADWFTIQSETLANEPMPKFMMYVPAYYTNKDDGLNKIIVENNTIPFQDFRRFMAPFFTVVDLDRELFSVSGLPLKGAST